MWGLESVALVPTRIWPDFPLILSFPLACLREYPVAVTGESLKASHQLCEGLIGGPSFEGRYGAIRFGVEGFEKTFEDNLFSGVLVDYE